MKLIAFAPLLLLFTLGQGQTTNEEISQEDKLFLAHANRVLDKIKDFNYFELQQYISKEHGLRFSPYAMIDTTSDVVFYPGDFKKNIQSKKDLFWGLYDGSGDSIKLSFAKYHQKFVYDVDFVNAEKTSIDEFIGKGNSINNLKEMYPNCRFVEYHFSGIDEKYDGMDWRSLRLVFKKIKAEYYLVGIVHSQWTI